MPYRNADRHAGRTIGFQRPGWRRNASALRRGQQRLRGHEAAIRYRTWHKHAAFTDQCISATTERSVLYAHAWRSHGGFRRHHDAALVSQGTEDRHRLQFRRSIGPGVHQQLPKICRPHC